MFCLRVFVECFLDVVSKKVHMFSNKGDFLLLVFFVNDIDDENSVKVVVVQVEDALVSKLFFMKARDAEGLASVGVVLYVFEFTLNPVEFAHIVAVPVLPAFEPL